MMPHIIETNCRLRYGKKNPPFSLGLLEPRSQAIKDSQVLPQTFLYWPLSSSDLGSKEREKGTLLLLGFGLPSLSLFCGKIGFGLFLKFSTPFVPFPTHEAKVMGNARSSPREGEEKKEGLERRSNCSVRSFMGRVRI